MLAPHRRENAELGHVRCPSQDCDGALELLFREPEFLGERSGDVAPTTHCNAPINPVKNALPSVLPSSGSVAFSGCGIRPRIVRLSLRMPAIARAEPLKFCASERPPSDPQ